MFFKLCLFSVCTHKREITLCSHPAENMHKPKVYMKGQGPSPRLVVGMVRSCASPAPVRGGLDSSVGQAVPRLRGLKQARAIAKGLFDALKVVPLPALPRPLLLWGGDASALHAQLSLSILIDEGQGDGGKMPWGKAEGREVSDQGFHRGLRRGGKRKGSGGRQSTNMLAYLLAKI